MAIAPIASYELPSAGSWPACRAPFRLEPARSALLVHDMQAYFLRPFDASEAPLRPVLAHVELLRKACAARAIPVIFSAQPEQQSRAERGLLWDLWGPGITERLPLEGSVELTPGPLDTLLLKRRYSAFFETRLEQLLREQGRDQLLIVGVYAHIGCLASALDGFMRGVQPFLVADATADFTREDHELALRQVARTCGVVLSTEDVLDAFESTSTEGAGANLG